jgi:hypothetical protein
MDSQDSTGQETKTLALRAIRYYDEHVERPMSDIAKGVYAGHIQGHESDPEIAAFAKKYDIKLATV